MALFGISAAATAVRGVGNPGHHPAPLHRHLADRRTADCHRHPPGRVLPIAIWLGFAAGLPAAIALGHARSPALATLWLAIAVAEPATVPASASQQPQGTDRQRCRQRPATSDHLPGSPLAGRDDQGSLIASIQPCRGPAGRHRRREGQDHCINMRSFPAPQRTHLPPTGWSRLMLGDVPAYASSRSSSSA
jgi:hypothetical protein